MPADDAVVGSDVVKDCAAGSKFELHLLGGKRMASQPPHVAAITLTYPEFGPTGVPSAGGAQKLPVSDTNKFDPEPAAG